MRKLMWFTVGYAAAAALGTYLLRGGTVLFAALICGLLAAGALRFRENPIVKRAGILLLGAVIGALAFFAYEQIVLRPIAALDGREVALTVRVTDYSWETDYGCAADGTAEIAGRTYKIRFYLNDPAELEPGNTVELRAKLRLTDEGGVHEPTFHRTGGILLLAFQRGECAISQGARQWLDWAADWRHRLTGVIDECFPADAAGFAKALVFGDRTGIDYEASTDFSITGVSHVVAVSGLHVSILCAVVYLFSRKRRFLTAIIGIPMLWCFAAVVGFSPSVTRAVIMQSIMLLALMADREYDPPTALSAAVLLMLANDPLTAASVGFQLSVSSVAGIFLFYSPICEWLKQYLPGRGKTLRGYLERWFTSSVAVTLSANIMTVPLTAVYFETVSLIGVVTNLLVLFVISGIFYGVGLVCLIGVWNLTLGSALAWLVAYPIRYVLAVTHWLSQVPIAAVYTASPYIVLWLVLLYGLLAWLMCSGKKRVALAAVCAVLGLCMSLMLSYLEPLTCAYRVSVLDVGQGQCVVLQSEGSTFLVDCGGDYDDDAADIAARYLLSQGISRIDGLILTHYDRDHAGGVPYLAHRIDIARVYLPQTEDADGCLQGVLDAVPEQVGIDSDTVISFGDAQIRIFPAKMLGSGNDSCASVLFQRGKCDTLITGDLSSSAERELLGDYALPDLEVLIVGHHGSKYSTCAELLEATAPDTAIISVGADNPYGHPTDEVLERLKGAGCAVYRTDLHGTITYRG
ncbi:MAG: DNA internalization-related competence protein ComEC/Rec2 [Oscillospiraceae bacterium]|nr:DNA internalization-related competence protein ComEC/Rec2 [Oscillospiraceae bacterium]